MLFRSNLAVAALRSLVEGFDTRADETPSFCKWQNALKTLKLGKKQNTSGRRSSSKGYICNITPPRICHSYLNEEKEKPSRNRRLSSRFRSFREWAISMGCL